VGNNDIRRVIEFENSLKVGDTCLAYWTNCGRYYDALVEVVSVNSKSFGVKVVNAIEGYPSGHRLNIPRFTNFNRWSWNNRLASRVEVKV
jgi:hypothetical protein